MNFNKTFFAGNLTRDPELRYTPKGTAVLDFSLATNRKWHTEAGEERKEETYLDCQAWGAVAENIAKFFTKGRNLFIEGRLQNQKWTDKQTQQPRSKMICVVDEWQFGSSPREPGDRSDSPPGRPASQTTGTRAASDSQTTTGPRSQSAAALRRNPGPPPPAQEGPLDEGMQDDDIPF